MVGSMPCCSMVIEVKKECRQQYPGISGPLTGYIAWKKQRGEPLVLCVQVRIVASMPCYSEATVNEQRGRGVFERSISGLRALNAAGYGQPGTGLTLDLVYNPNGAFLAPPTATLQVGLPPIYGIPHCPSEHIYCGQFTAVPMMMIL